MNPVYFSRRYTTTVCAKENCFVLRNSDPTVTRFCVGASFSGVANVTLRCWKNGALKSRTEVLSGSGVLYNASGCSVAVSGFQTLQELLGDTQATPDAPRLYVPDKSAVIAGHELQALEEMVPSEIVRLDEVTAPRQITDVNSLFHANRDSLRRQK